MMIGIAARAMKRFCDRIENRKQKMWKKQNNSPDAHTETIQGSRNSVQLQLLLRETLW